MANPFDELTLAEVDEMSTVCFEGKSFDQVSPFNLAGGVMYMHRKRDKPEVEWLEFKASTNMGEIKVFSELMSEEENPTNGEIPTV